MYLIYNQYGYLYVQDNLQDSLATIHYITGRVSDTLQVNGDGSVSSFSIGIEVWLNYPVDALKYPGLPTSSAEWALTISSSGVGIAVTYGINGPLFWSSDTGITYATQRAYGYPALGINEYIQSNTGSFFLKGLDGKTCKFQGTYPTETDASARSCLP